MNAPLSIRLAKSIPSSRILPSLVRVYKCHRNLKATMALIGWSLAAALWLVRKPFPALYDKRFRSVRHFWRHVGKCGCNDVNVWCLSTPLPDKSQLSFHLSTRHLHFRTLLPIPKHLKFESTQTTIWSVKHTNHFDPELPQITISHSYRIRTEEEVSMWSEEDGTCESIHP